MNVYRADWEWKSVGEAGNGRVWVRLGMEECERDWELKCVGQTENEGT